jgi:hypothetical protein
VWIQRNLRDAITTFAGKPVMFAALRDAVERAGQSS